MQAHRPDPARHAWALRWLGALGLSLAAILPAAAQDAATATVAKPAPMSAVDAARQARQRQSARVWRHDASPEAAAGIATLGLSTEPAVIEQGRRLYQEGLRSDGRPLVGRRLEGQVAISGAAAACMLCHRRSGLGAVEGPNQISPISGRYLFDQDRRALANMNLRARKSFNHRHEAYTLQTLGRALREGVHESGRELEALMPRYELSDAEVLALGSYLRQLSNAWSPGVADKQVRLAVVITPDVTPERRRIFLGMVNGIVAQKNGNLIHGQRTMSSGAEMMLQTDRSWDMQVWELEGAASTWQEQLQRLQAAKPVFAVATGLGAGNWAPVHRFCEQQRVPCWFPSVAAVPPESETGFYSMYFSRGVALEAEVLARHLETGLTGKPAKAARARVLQVYADQGVAESALPVLRKQLEGLPLNVEDWRLGSDRAALAAKLAGLGAADKVVFWLDPLQLESLKAMTPPKAASYFSAALGGEDKLPLDAQWRAAAHVIYPYQLPQQRRRGLTVFREWLRVRNVPLEDEVLQSEVYFALDYLNDTLVDMLDNVHRDYLLERGENMLSLREGARAEDEARGLSLPRSDQVDKRAKPLRDMPVRAIIPRQQPRNAVPAGGERPPGPSAHSGGGMLAAGAAAPADDSTSGASGAPTSTSVYPRLSLGQFQRHASKGAYITRYAAEADTLWQAETAWLTP